MDQIKIGKFIAECRKKVNLTQMQLSEKLGITDKAISKWERGIAMPDTSIMLELCEILGISVNELLSGEKICMENNDQKNEQLLYSESAVYYCHYHRITPHRRQWYSIQKSHVCRSYPYSSLAILDLYRQ